MSDGAMYDDDTTKLPAVLRKALEGTTDRAPLIVDRQTSADDTRKYVFRLHDGSLVEAVGMPHDDQEELAWLTVCFSSQVGCARACAFCATGRQGFTRNLTADEMIWQIVLVGQDYGLPVNKVVAMGQGEPLDNYEALVEAVKVIGHPEGLGIGLTDLGVATSGSLEGIRALAEDCVPVLLAISLHATRQSVRDALMPSVRTVPIDVLHDELVRYCVRTGRGIHVHYMLLKGVNDSMEDLAGLQEFCRGLDASVNLLQFNDFEGTSFLPSPFGTVVVWASTLRQHGIRTHIISPRGADIAAACGQLKNQVSMAAGV